MNPFTHSDSLPEGHVLKNTNSLDLMLPPEYNFAQLRLLIHALEMLDTSQYDTGYTEVYKHLIARFRHLMKEYESR